MKKNLLNYFFLLLVYLNFIYFFAGFYYQHDFSNGGKIDFEHFYNNLLLFKDYDFIEIPWEKYESTTLPIYYLFLKYIIPRDNIFFFKFFGFSISLIIVFLIYINFKVKYNLRKFNINLFLLSTIPLISSSYRTDAFHGMEKNFGLLFLTLGIIFFNLKNKSKKFLYLAIFFSSLTFYTKQIYCFFPIIIYFGILYFKDIFSNKNIFYSFLFFIFLVPSTYFFYKWDGLVSPVAAQRISKINFYNIPNIFGQYLIFLTPFFIFLFIYKKNIANFLKFSLNKLLFIFLLYLIYIYFFIDIKFQNFGGGPVLKLALILGDNYFSKILYLSLSFIGLIFSIVFCRLSKEFFIYFFFTSGVVFFADNIFFGYLDPLAFLIIIFFFPFKFSILSSNKFVLISIFYFLTLHISYIFYYSYYIGNIIR